MYWTFCIRVNVNLRLRIFSRQNYVTLAQSIGYWATWCLITTAATTATATPVHDFTHSVRTQTQTSNRNAVLESLLGRFLVRLVGFFLESGKKNKYVYIILPIGTGP
uniref:Uncharacterized protein n=1 Tax=Cacopsylla melanoneura TaxID=428564 RepID=A0A8D8TK75_9HEMI